MPYNPGMNLQRCLALGLAGSLIAGSAPAWAQTAAAAGVGLSPESKWQSTQGHSAESGFSRADQIVFNQVATQGRLEQLCRNIALSGNINQAFPSSEGSFLLGVLRRLVTLPSVEHPQNLELYQ